MNQQQSQVHLIKTTVNLKRVNITVRFPCSISFALKNQNNIVEHKGIHQLRRGECLINHPLDIQMQICFRRGIYEQKKISLLIYMISVNGKIPAGSVTINPTERVIADRRAPLEKCPDKNAQATFTQSFEMLQLIRKSFIPQKLVLGVPSSPMAGDYLIRSRLKLSTSSHNIFRTEEGQLHQESVRTQYTPEDQSLYSSKYRQSNHDLRLSGAFSNQFSRKTSKIRMSKFEQISRKSISGNLERDSSQRASRISSQINIEDEQDFKIHNRRIHKLQQDKADYQQKLAQMRDSLVRIDAQQRSELQQQIQRVKNQNDALEDEMQTLKEKTKSHERREYQSKGLVRELRDELDKRKSRILQLDSSKSKIQIQVSEKDKQIIQLQNEKKKLQEQVQQEKSIVVSCQKRLELKETSYKQQLKKITEKYGQSESERQRAVMDYNNLLASIQSNQKKNQINFREKEKGLIEQKAKLSKKIEQLTNQTTINSQRLSELRSIQDEYKLFKKKALQKQEQRQSKIVRLSQENEALLTEIRSIEENSVKVLQQKQKLQNLFNEDKVNYKRKYTDAANQLTTLKQRFQKSNKTCLSLESKVHTLQAQSQKQLKEKNCLIVKIEQYKRLQQRYMIQQQNRERMTETLSVQSLNQNQRLSEMRAKIQAQKNKYDQMQTKYQQQVQYLVKSKQMLQNETEQLKWLLERQVQKFQDLCLKNRQLNEQIIKLNHRIIQLEQKCKMNQNSIQTKQELIKEKDRQITNLDEKVRSTLDRLREKQQQRYNLFKKTEGYQQQIQIFGHNMVKYNKIIDEKNETIRKVEQLSINQIKDKDKETIQLNQELYTCKQLISSLKEQINARNTQLLIMKESYKTINSDYSSVISMSDYYKQEDKIKNAKIEELQLSLQQKKYQVSSLQKELQKKKIQFEQYKTANIKSFEQFFALLNKDQIDTKRQSFILLNAPDQKLSMLQMQSIKKRCVTLAKHQQQITQLSNMVENYQKQLKKQQTYMDQLQIHHSDILKREQQRYTALAQQNSKQICQLMQKIQALTANQDKFISQIDYLSSEGKRYQSVIQDLNENINKFRTDNCQLKSQMLILQNEIFSLKQKQIKSKMSQSIETEQLKHILQLQKDRSKQLIESLKEDLKTKQKVINEKIEEIKKLMASEGQHKIQKVKLKDQIKQLQKRIQQQVICKQSLQKQIRQKQKMLKTIEEDLLEHKFKIQQLKVRQIAYQQQNKRYKSEIQIIEKKLKTNKEEHEEKFQQICQAERKQRQKRQKIEAGRIKLQQQNKQIKQKCVKLQSQVQFSKFYKIQSQKKIEQLQKYRYQTMNDLTLYRQNSVKSEKELSVYQNKSYKLQVQLQGLIKEKSIVLQQNFDLKEKTRQLDQKLISYQSAISQLQSKDKQIIKLNSVIKSNQQQYQKMVTDLKASVNKSKQSLAEKQSKIKQLQKFLQQRYNDISNERQKWQKQHDNEKNQLQIKIAQLQDRYQMIQQQYQFQKLQAIREIQGTNGIIQQLNEVIREKEQTLQNREQIINEQVVRLQELNIQLNQCVQKWNAQKESYLPTEAKMAEINEELTRMNKFIGDLDGRNKQLLQINKRKMQQNIVSRPSITEQLKQVYVLLQKNKNRILNRCQTDKEKEIVISEFKTVQDKLDLTLKSTQIIPVKQ